MSPSEIDVREHRKPRYPCADIFVERWSPRAMSGEEVTDQELMTLFEAARWAPSAFNGQPWRFVYARRDTEHWGRLFDLLVDFNKQWCSEAGALVVIVSRKTFEHNDKLALTHSFDAGAAWQSLALQGSMLGLVVHGMQGFDYERASEALGVPENCQVEAMAAVGRPGRVEQLAEGLREREVPSTRKPVEEFVFEGSFGKRAG